MTWLFPNIPRFVHRNAVALPAAGAMTQINDGSYASGNMTGAQQWNVSASSALNGALFIPDGIFHVHFWLTYTRSPGQAGAVAAGCMVTNGTEMVRLPIVDSPITVTNGLGQQSVYPWDLAALLAPSSDAPVAYPFLTFDVFPGQWCWLQARETGAPGTPGTLLVAATASP